MPNIRSWRRIVEAPYDPAHHRFNDGRCDAAGRFYVGYMNEKRDAPSAALMRIDAAGSMTEVFGGFTISNGLAWSPEARTK
jgi:sugar lactone lactonase YvrE